MKSQIEGIGIAPCVGTCYVPRLGQVGKVVHKRARAVGIAVYLAFNPFIVAELDIVGAALLVGDAQSDAFVAEVYDERCPAEHVVGKGERDVPVVVFGALPLTAYGTEVV